MIRRRRVAVFTGSRADYGLLRPVLAAMEASETLEARLVVGGSHASRRHGSTLDEILADGRTPAASIPCELEGDDGVSAARDMALTLAGAAEIYRSEGVEAVLVLGDRTEAFAAACAAAALALPIIHLEGGHRTTGAIDDALRHAMTKLASLHFTAAEPYRRRLLQMGEAPERVFTVGSTGVDNLLAFGRSDVDQASAITGIDLRTGFLLATFHPETLSALPAEAQISRFLDGLTRGADGRMILFTGSNADTGSTAFAQAISAFDAAHPENVRLSASLGARGYAAAMTSCALVIGNSSSGVIEAPAAGAPSVNVGDRQEGRIRTPSVIDCPLEPQAIASAMRRALDPYFARAARLQPPPFGDGRAAARIVDVLERTDFSGLSRKPFVDL